ncbi:hypothetical protein FJV83_31750 [Mesorhizobium sp. WSM4307]|uniref:hypothetical protein n=1 Tax=unclassified Mesorhizobium TaxID=325217 RepID=UPI00115EC9AB|nr:MULTISPECIES: hypothetical protein [unclassified Mesorhizobium]TRC70778.1 hypothetical protein FJV81_35475 [Mesorhizobium sp. WSM4315]TRC77870.1 hypothetical protein FJV83_31750 [Mesorhizobium sp. WSM4307]TRC80654.1 hypothetical protein FJV80_22600 [Mesorhizobium sp. WSM4310]TRD00077.1 hypothetical protein FJV82_22335 [Mesorhizobium sp. WSM4305]
MKKYDVAILGGGGAGMAVTVATRDAWLPLSDFRFGSQEICCNDSSRNTERKMNPDSFDARRASTPCKKNMAVSVGLQC